MKFGLTETTVENICAVFARFPEIEKAVLYGSRAKGNFKTGSDIDLTLCGEALTSDLCSTIASELDDLLLPYTIDLSVFNEINHVKLREHIERVGVLFYKRAEQGIAMKKGWKTSTLGDTCEMYQPKTITGKEMVKDGAYPVFGANGVIGRYDKFNHEEPQLLITCRGATCGTVNISEPQSWITGNAMVIRPKNGSINMRFLEYLFRGGIDISKAITGTAQPQITRTNLAPLEISYPVAIEEQQRIVGILDAAFDGIATAKANAEKNLQNARTIFESHLQSVFTQRGEGWVRTTIGDQVMLQRGFDITKDEQNKGDIPVVSSGGIKSFHDKAMVQAPGVVIGRKGTLGKVFYLETDFWPHDTTLWVRNFKGNDPRFVYYFFTGLDVKRLDSGTANPALNRNQVHPIEIDWPPISRQKAIVATLDALLSETQRLASVYERKIAALGALKKSLLHQAFCGEL